MSRDHRIDTLRGLAITLVVLGHAAQRSGELLPDSALVRAVLSFNYWHMALFMALSGYLTFGRVPDGSQQRLAWVKAKALMLMVPYFAWSIVYYWIPDPFINKAGGFLGYLRLVVLAPSNTLWFFWVLFMCYCVIAVLGSTSRWWLIAFGTAVSILPIDSLGFDLLGWYWWWFVVGYLLASIQARGTLVWRYRAAPVAAAYVCALLFIGQPAALWERAVWGAVGALAATVVASLLSRTVVAPVASALGRESFAIYAGEFLFLWVPWWSTSLWRIPALTVLAILGSGGLAAAMRRSSLLNRLFLGGRA